MLCVYEQKTGNLFANGILLAKGYAGNGVGRNSPAHQEVRSVGPLPRGQYRAALQQHPRFHKPSFRLIPMHQPMFGRSHFWLHGGTISHGCIIIPLAARLKLPVDFSLTVTSGEAVDSIVTK